MGDEKFKEKERTFEGSEEMIGKNKSSEDQKKGWRSTRRPGGSAEYIYIYIYIYYMYIFKGGERGGGDGERARDCEC